MDAAPVTALVQTQAVRALLAQVEAVPQQNLLALMGQTLEMTFQGMGPQGAQLVLASGQTLVAQGELPFAQGTQLTVKVLSETEGSLRLQIQEAKPPTSPAVLQPLLTGEAQPLMARMLEGSPSESLAPLVQMLKQVLESARASAPSATLSMPQAEEAVTALPAELIQPLRQALGLPPGQPLAQALKAWVESPVPTVGSQELLPTAQPALARPGTAEDSEVLDLRTVLASVGTAFAGQMSQASAVPEPQRDFLSTWFQGLLAKASAFPEAASQPHTALPAPLVARLPQTVASLPAQTAEFLRQALNIPEGEPLALGLRSWMESVLSKAQASPSVIADSRLGQAGAEIQDLAQRFEALIRQAPDFPKSQRAFITSWFRELLVKAGGIETAAKASATGAPQTHQPSSVAATEANSAALQQALHGADTDTPASKAPLEEPAFWNKWVRSTVEALADPQVSPREAPFHALQAREGTAYFELPAPWLPQGVVQLWVESDAPEGGRPGDETRRVFMGLYLSNLGDTRLGLELSGANLNVRVWTEHPENLASQQDALVKELEGTDRTVNLRILPLGTGTPSLRSLVVGNSWQGLG